MLHLPAFSVKNSSFALPPTNWQLYDLEVAMSRRATATGSIAPSLPLRPTLEELRAAAAECRACDLWQKATQTVFGEGESTTLVMLVGEQPGDQEDRVGKPFVGPAGRLLDRALATAGIDRSTVYVTNVVKHFKWIAKGGRRLHQTPDSSEISACRPWLDSEITKIKPRVIVCLGATAAQTLLGKQFRVTRQRGEFIPSPLAPTVLATIHPSAILRIPDEKARRVALERFVEDLRKVPYALTNPLVSKSLQKRD
jgi:DNA polymerase